MQGIFLSIPPGMRGRAEGTYCCTARGEEGGHLESEKQLVRLEEPKAVGFKLQGCCGARLGFD